MKMFCLRRLEVMVEWRVQGLEEMQRGLETDGDEVKHSGGEGNAEK